jgi:putative NADH-flavin reductase
MKIAVLGATRGIGLALTKLALEQGNEVTALLRDPGRMTLSHPNLHLVTGDIRNLASIKAAVDGHDAVCTCIGVSPSRKPIDTFSLGARNVLAALDSSPEMKFVAVTGIGAGDSRGHGGFFYDKLLQPLLLKAIYEDKDREEAIIKASNANWIIVRPGTLTNGVHTGKYRVLTDMHNVTAGKIARVDVADFILKQLANPTHFKQTPLVTY